MPKPGELFLFVFLPKKSLGWWLLLLLLLLLLTLVPGIGSSEVDELKPLLPVETTANAETSVTLSWKLPNISAEGVHITAISIRYSSQSEPEKEIIVPPYNTSQLINDLKPGTTYRAYVTAHYSNNKNVSTEKFDMMTISSLDGYKYREESCHKYGTRQVEKLPAGPRCLCQTGYQGKDCDVCSDGFYMSMDKCLQCPCSKESSLGTCHMGSDEDGIACNCQDGYIGPRCESCKNGFYQVKDNCISCHCLTCDDKLSECEQCPEYRLQVTKEQVSQSCSINVSSPTQTIKYEDGTVAIVAVVISLAFIACVASGITCYRNRIQARNQVPFWSIELADDKVSLNTGSDYQRLEGSSKQHLKSGHHRTSSVAEAAVAMQRAEQPQYNCISI